MWIFHPDCGSVLSLKWGETPRQILLRRRLLARRPGRIDVRARVGFGAAGPLPSGGERVASVPLRRPRRRRSFSSSLRRGCRCGPRAPGRGREDARAPMEQLYGILLYGVFLLTMGGIYAVLTPRAQHPVGLHRTLQRRGGRVLRDRGLHHGYPDHRCLDPPSRRFRPPGGGRPRRRDARERAHRVGRGPGLHPAAQRLSRDRDPRDRGDLPARPQERDMGNQRRARDLADTQALRASPRALGPGRDAAARVRVRARALRPSSNGPAAPRGDG